MIHGAIPRCPSGIKHFWTTVDIVRLKHGCAPKQAPGGCAEGCAEAQPLLRFGGGRLRAGRRQECRLGLGGGAGNQ